MIVWGENMTFVEMTALSILLGADLFSVAVAIGMTGVNAREVVRLSAVFALFHMMMLFLGWAGGAYLARTIERLGAASDIPLIMAENWAGLFGGAVLTFFGLYLIGEGLRPQETVRRTVPQGGALILLGISVSCDALAVGLGMGLLAEDRTRLTAILGIVIFLVSTSGLLLGRGIGGVLTRAALPLGGAVLTVWGIYRMAEVVR